MRPKPLRNNPARVRGYALVAALICLAAGCRCPDCGERSLVRKHGLFSPDCKIDNCANVPLGALPAPLGTYVRNYQHAQTTKARGDQFVIYERDWVSASNDPDEFSTELGPGAGRYLKRIIDALPTVSGPIILEPTANKKLDRAHRRELDERRYQQIVTQLYLEGIEHPETRVVVAYPNAESIHGEEAVRIYSQILAPQTGLGGFGNAGGLGGIGGFGGGGLGGIGGFGGIGGGVVGGGIGGFNGGFF